MLILVNEYLGENGSGSGSAKLYYYSTPTTNLPTKWNNNDYVSKGLNYIRKISDTGGGTFCLAEMFCISFLRAEYFSLYEFIFYICFCFAWFVSISALRKFFWSFGVVNPQSLF